MKVITDYFAPPFASDKVNKSNKKLNKPGSRKNSADCDNSVESIVTEDNDEVYYETRKIKIRLADPNVPDSYVCEVYDTSIDDEGQQVWEESAKDIVDEIQDVEEIVNIEENAFDLLMASAEKNFKGQQQIVKKRSRSNKTPHLDDSESSSDEALILVKKKLRTSDRAAVVGKEEVAEAEAPVQRVRTRSQSSDVVQVPLCTSSCEQKQLIRRTDSKQSGGTIKKYFKRRPGSENVEFVNEIGKNADQSAAKVEVTKKTSHPVPEDKDNKKRNQTLAKVEGNKKESLPTREVEVTGKISQSVAKNKSQTVENVTGVKVRLKKKGKETEKGIVEGVKLRHSKRLGERSTDSTKGVKTEKEETQIIESPCKKECRIVLEKIPDKKLPLRKIPLAPLFVRKPKKEVVDPEVIIARQQFLQLGLPTATRKRSEIMKAQEAEEVPFFPSVTHIQQRSNEALWSKRNIELTLNETGDYVTPVLLWKTHVVQRKSVVSDSNRSQLKKVKTDDVAIEKMKSIYKNVDVEALHEALKKKKFDYLETKSNKVSKDGVTEPSPVWHDKYRPGSAELQSNDKTVAKLGKWFMAWKRYGEELQTGVRNARSSGESSDDFVSSDDEEESPRAPVTACLLQGPPSSGKTALIHALASEMDFHILEINSASKRSGKKMLSDLQEATQSHKILQEANGNLGRSMPGNGKDGMAVIVVEEADILFEEQDDGFISGLQTLISSAKRPVVLLTGDASVSHLDKFRTKTTLQLSMVRPHLSAACAILELISLVEGVSPPRSSLLRLLARNKLDIRRSLLELQFWLQCDGRGSKGWDASDFIPLTAGSLWWSSHHLIFQQDLWHSDCPPLSKPRSSGVSDSSSPEPIPTENHKPDNEVLSRMFSYYETVSSSDVLKGKKIDRHFELNYSDVEVKDSSSLEENLWSENWRQQEIVSEIEADILARSIRCLQSSSRTQLKTDGLQTGIPNKEVRWLASRRKAMKELLQVVPSHSAGSARHCDYLPALREISRSEQDRARANTKRRNRFYHYLRTLGASPTQANLDINCKTFRSDA